MLYTLIEQNTQAAGTETVTFNCRLLNKIIAYTTQTTTNKKGLLFTVRTGTKSLANGINFEHATDLNSMSPGKSSSSAIAVLDFGTLKTQGGQIEVKVENTIGTCANFMVVAEYDINKGRKAQVFTRYNSESFNGNGVSVMGMFDTAGLPTSTLSTTYKAGNISETIPANDATIKGVSLGSIQAKTAVIYQGKPSPISVTGNLNATGYYWTVSPLVN